jgi:hypothetical protein
MGWRKYLSSPAEVSGAVNEFRTEGRTPAMTTTYGRRTDLLVIVAAAAGCLLPFAGKPFHVDDPLFIWSAQQIHRHPFDPYGFTVNWDHINEPMWQVTQNPPLACYYAAAAGCIAWDEMTMHVAFLVPTIGTLWGTYRLADRFGAPPLLSALATLVMPAFLVSASTVMSDVPIVCAWVWALVLWDRGLRDRRYGALYGAGVLALIAVLTKYFAVSLIPLMAVYALAVDARGCHRWLLPLAVPIGGVVSFGLWTRSLYGRDLLGQAVLFAQNYESETSWTQLAWRGASALAFLGGGSGGMTLLLPRPLARSTWSLALTGAALAAILPSGVPWWLRAQFVGWALIGVTLLLVAIGSLIRSRGAVELLLVLWIGGTFVFTAFVNHSVNARSILPAMPALAILTLRAPVGDRGPAGPPWIWLIPEAALALVVTWADMRLARAGRRGAEVAAGYAKPDHTLWFHGHWGLQYYLQQAGGVPWDQTDSRTQPGDMVAIAYGFYPAPRPPDNYVRTVAMIDVPACPWLATMNAAAGAGFYSYFWGGLPYAFGPIAPEQFEIDEVVRPYGPAADGPMP